MTSPLAPFFVVGLLLIGLVSCRLPAQNQSIVVETGDFMVQVSGKENVPEYIYWLTSDPGRESIVFFTRIYEAIEEEDGNLTMTDFEVPFSGLDWVYTNPDSEFVEGLNSTEYGNYRCSFEYVSLEDCIGQFNEEKASIITEEWGCDYVVEIDPLLCSPDFDSFFSWSCMVPCVFTPKETQVNFFSITNYGREDGKWWEALTFRNNVNLLNTTQNIKVDILLEGYEFQTKGENVKLVFEMATSLASSPNNTNSSSFENEEEVSDLYAINNAYIISNPYAETNRGTIGAKMVSGEETGEETDVKLVFDRFHGGELVHDPKFGYAIGANVIILVDWSHWGMMGLAWFWWILISLVCLVVICLVGLIVLLRRRVRKSESGYHRVSSYSLSI